ncbi:MAG: hypothetical protein JKY67_13215 [Pseudomonadales bacterium]|nr:hypothetical protein [Pseudomonadales bacterium]
MRYLSGRGLGYFFCLITLSGLIACGGGSGGEVAKDPDNNIPDNSVNENNISEDTASGSGNQSRFFLDCDLQGLIGKMVMDVEIISSSGITWGSGPNPSITGVIGTGEYTLYVTGSLQSSNAYYVFNGENQFADFTELNTNERFRVQWVQKTNGLDMIVNPFGQGPTQHFCEQTGSQRI